METIVVRPRNAEELQLVTQLMKRMKIKTEVIQPETAAQKREHKFLASIDRAATEVKAHLRGEIKLQSAEDFLNEL